MDIFVPVLGLLRQLLCLKHIVLQVLPDGYRRRHRHGQSTNLREYLTTVAPRVSSRNSSTAMGLLCASPEAHEHDRSPRDDSTFKILTTLRESERADPAVRRLQGNRCRAAAQEHGEPRATVGLKGKERGSFLELDR